MTLLATEISEGPPPTIVFAADRRISLGGRRHAERRKILPLPRRRAGIGYFGLAELPVAGPRRNLDRWLADFLQAKSRLVTLAELANELAEELNRVLPIAVRRAYVSGFHRRVEETSVVL